jgi:hypothetical protein
MPVDERSRHALYLKLETLLGREEASTLMEHLPPVGWADVATKRDLDQLAVATKRDLDQLAVATKRDLDQLAEANQREHQQLAETFKLGHEALENRLAAQFRGELVAQTRTIFLGMIGLFLTAMGVSVAVS